MASRADDTASFVSKKSTSQAVMFTSRLVLPSAMTWTEKSACVANWPHLHKHPRARLFCCLLVLWCCRITVGSGASTTAAYSLVLSHVTKKRNKKKTSQKERKAMNFGKVLFPSN